MSFSDYLEGKVLDHVFKNTAYTQPTTVYVALFTGDPTDAGNLTYEISNHANYSSGYTRQSVSFDRSGNILTNDAQIDYGPVVTTGTITITYAAIIDGDTLGAGNILASEALSESKALTNGGYLRWSAGDLEDRLY
jgi:hypothetical protein